MKQYNFHFAPHRLSPFYFYLSPAYNPLLASAFVCKWDLTKLTLSLNVFCIVQHCAWLTSLGLGFANRMQFSNIRSAPDIKFSLHLLHFRFALLHRRLVLNPFLVPVIMVRICFTDWNCLVVGFFFLTAVNSIYIIKWNI